MSSTTNMPTAPTGRPRRRIDLSTLAAFAAIAALCAGMAAGQDGSGTLVTPIATLSLLLVVASVIHGFTRAARSPDVLRPAVGGLVLAGATALAGLGVTFWFGPQAALIVGSFIVGVGLVGEWLVRALERVDHGQTPWQQLATMPRAPRDAFRLARLLVGAALLLWALLLFVSTYAVLLPSWGGLVSVGLLVGGVGVLMTIAVLPIVVLERARHRRTRALHDRALDRQAVAAHLHDSVLQTLALIQRTKDPDQVVLLARQQERALRGWLAGRDEGEGTSLAAALRGVAAEVEGEYPGLTVECVTAGDAVLDERVDAIVRAAREALRNAGRHATGADVRLFLEAEEAELVVYVRDTGPGFDPAAVPEERRGVRDAILGRMAHAGGSAEIDTGEGGTEVVLRLPARRHRPTGASAPTGRA